MNLLVKDNLPYLLTVLIGLVAYQINSIITIYTDAPILAYRFTELSSQKEGRNNKGSLKCELINYNRKRAIENIHLLVQYRTSLPNPKKVTSPEIVAIAPSFILPDSMRRNAFNLANQYKIPIIHPHAKYILKLETIANPSIKEYPKIYLDSKKSIRLVSERGNFRVFLIKNELVVNLLLLISWMLFIVFYTRYLSKQKKKENDKKSD